MAGSEDIELLRKIVEQGGSKYTAGNIDRRKYESLVEQGWLTRFSPNIGDIVYEVTESGKAAAASTLPE
jgi:hypothetical protein